MKNAIIALSGAGDPVTPPIKVYSTMGNGYPKGDSWQGKIKYIVSGKGSATASDIIGAVVDAEPGLNEETVYNSITATLSKMKKQHLIKATRLGKGYVYRIA